MAEAVEIVQSAYTLPPTRADVRNMLAWMEIVIGAGVSLSSVLMLSLNITAQPIVINPVLVNLRFGLC